MFKWFRCKGCERLEKENQYLKKLVDRLLDKKGVAPVQETEFSIETELPLEKVKEGTEQYGD